MLTVHHLGVSQSDRIVWLCEELDLAYELKRYDRDPATRQAPADYKALHPSGTAPVITDGDLTLGESGAIAEYILGKYGQGRLTLAPDHPNYPDYLYWLHAGQGSFMPAMMMDLVARAMGGQPAGAAPRASRSDTAFANIEARLGQAPYLAGEDFTAADIMTLFFLTTGRLYAPRDLAPYPNIRAYLERIGARPAFRRAMAKADPDLAIPLA
jgi:glutathione S-transferase